MVTWSASFKIPVRRICRPDALEAKGAELVEGLRRRGGWDQRSLRSSTVSQLLAAGRTRSTSMPSPRASGR